MGRGHDHQAHAKCQTKPKQIHTIHFGTYTSHISAIMSWFNSEFFASDARKRNWLSRSAGNANNEVEEEETGEEEEEAALTAGTAELLTSSAVGGRASVEDEAMRRMVNSTAGSVVGDADFEAA